MSSCKSSIAAAMRWNKLAPLLIKASSQQYMQFSRQCATLSVTRLGDLLGQLFKAFGKICLPKPLTFLGNFCKCVKIFNFTSGHTGDVQIKYTFTTTYLGLTTIFTSSTIIAKKERTD